MKRLIALVLLLTVITGGFWLAGRNSEEQAVRQVMDEIRATALDGLNGRNPDALDEYFTRYSVVTVQ